MGTNFSQQTMQTSITEHEYRVEALQKRIKELESVIMSNRAKTLHLY